VTNDTRKAAKTTTQAWDESGAKEGTAVAIAEVGAEFGFVGMTRNHTEEWAIMPRRHGSRPDKIFLWEICHEQTPR